MKTMYFANIRDFHAYNQLPEPESPLCSVTHTKQAPQEQDVCGQDFKPFNVEFGFYNISLKRIVSGEIHYGRTTYDCSNGTMIFTAPNQQLRLEGLSYSDDTYHISFHKDFLIGHPLYDKIKRYNFFNYHINEALHLSPKEEARMKLVFQNMLEEYDNNPDEFSRELLLSQLDTLLQYAHRYYKRQFMAREVNNQRLFSQFKGILDRYFDQEKFQELGIPSLEWIAQQLGVSHRYMSDTIKAETGKTAIDQINLYLVEEAKSRLLMPNTSISETAYTLGFEYPQYFSRLFKRKTGMSPSKYVEMYG